MTMVGNKDDQNQYVLAILLPSNMPWSEEEPGVSFWDWFAKVFSSDDSWELGCFLDVDVPLVQEQEYVTAYPTKANSHPLMKHSNGFDKRLLPNTFDYHPSVCVKLILRNVRTKVNHMPPAIYQKCPTLDKFWCAVQTTWLRDLSARRNSMMRSHPDTLNSVLAPEWDVVKSHLMRFVETNLLKIQQELVATAGGKGSAEWHLRDPDHPDRERKMKRLQCRNLKCMRKLLTWRTDSPREQKSTLWNPAAPRRNLLTAADIGTSNCSWPPKRQASTLGSCSTGAATRSSSTRRC